MGIVPIIASAEQISEDMPYIIKRSIISTLLSCDIDGIYQDRSTCDLYKYIKAIIISSKPLTTSIMLSKINYSLSLLVKLFCICAKYQILFCRIQSEI
jgi:hypothetical protein